MSGTLQVGGITLGTHNSGTGKVDITNAGTFTSTGAITASGGIANAVTISAVTIGTGVTINAGTNVSGIGQLVGVSSAGNSSTNTDGNDVTVDPNKNYIITHIAWNGGSGYIHSEIWRAVGNGTGHAFSSEGESMTGGMEVQVGAGGNGTLRTAVNNSFAYSHGLVFEEGSTHDID